MLRTFVEGYRFARCKFGTAKAGPITLAFWVLSYRTGVHGGSVANSPAPATRSYPFTYTVNAANTWEYKTVTIPGDTTGSWDSTNGIGLRVNFGLGVGTTYSGPAGAWASANYLSATGAVSLVQSLSDVFYVTGLTVLQGTQAPSETQSKYFQRQYGEELELCRRYYQKTVMNSVSGYNTVGNYVFDSFPISPQMRQTPTITLSNAVSTNASTLTSSNASPTSHHVRATVTPSLGTGLITFDAALNARMF
jgi:hypothetical protein